MHSPRGVDAPLVDGVARMHPLEHRQQQLQVGGDVRRVGTRVFQNLLIYQRRDLQAPDILAATQLVTVRAKLDPNGKLKSLEVVDRSGSPAMDRTLVEALRQAAFDPNPPSGASNVDGDFEFIFQAQILANVQPGVKQRIRAVESRLRIGLM